MYLCFPTLSQISLKNSIGKAAFQILVTSLFLRKKQKFVFGRQFETEYFLNVLFLIYGCFRCIQIWYKLCTEKWLGQSGPPYAQTGVKSSLGTFKCLSYFSLLS